MKRRDFLQDLPLIVAAGALFPMSLLGEKAKKSPERFLVYQKLADIPKLAGLAFLYQNYLYKGETRNVPGFAKRDYYSDLERIVDEVEEREQSNTLRFRNSSDRRNFNYAKNLARKIRKRNEEILELFSAQITSPELEDRILRYRNLVSRGRLGSIYRGIEREVLGSYGIVDRDQLHLLPEEEKERLREIRKSIYSLNLGRLSPELRQRVLSQMRHTIFNKLRRQIYDSSSNKRWLSKKEKAMENVWVRLYVDSEQRDAIREYSKRLNLLRRPLKRSESSPAKTLERLLPYGDVIVPLSGALGLEFEGVMALLSAENAGLQERFSYAGAVGIGQLTYIAAAEIYYNYLLGKPVPKKIRMEIPSPPREVPLTPRGAVDWETWKNVVRDYIEAKHRALSQKRFPEEELLNHKPAISIAKNYLGNAQSPEQLLRMFAFDAEANIVGSLLYMARTWELQKRLLKKSGLWETWHSDERSEEARARQKWIDISQGYIAGIGNWGKEASRITIPASLQYAGVIMGRMGFFKKKTLRQYLGTLYRSR